MPEKKIIAVMGATGAQGGGLVRAILSDVSGGFKARAITRNVSSEKARELAKLGAEVVAADVDDVESLRKAFNGAYVAHLEGVLFAPSAEAKTLLENQAPQLASSGRILTLLPYSISIHSRRRDLPRRLGGLDRVRLRTVPFRRN